MNWKKILITLVRVAIGWHFLYEGFTKLLADGWSAQSFLVRSTGFLSGFYQWLGNSEGLLPVIDFLNIWGLIIIGLGLFLGVLVRFASIAGIVLLGLYYFAYPPFGASAGMATEGAVYLVNKNFIEAAVLAALLLFRERGFGLYALWPGLAGKIADDQLAAGSRREALKNLATLPVLGLMGWGAIRSAGKYGVDTLSGATIQIGALDISELKGELPMGKIGDHELSRLIMGGNLIGGWAHARDLIYASKLFRAYNTERKIFETIQIGEQAGINSINIGFPTNETMVKYKKVTGSKIKVICQVHPDMEHGDYFVNIDKAIDFGVDIIQIQGNQCDWLVRDNKTEKVGEMLDYIRKQGYVAGLGAHTVDALIACEDQGIIPDYYMKTMHHDNYWSAHPRENRVPFEVDGKNHLDHDKFHNNCFCLFPDQTVEFVNRVKVPVMGFKVLAAGAIHPEDGFEWAFRNGADFICVGMFDFQIVHDVNVTVDILNNLQGRTRQWYG